MRSSERVNAARTPKSSTERTETSMVRVPKNSRFGSAATKRWPAKRKARQKHFSPNRVWTKVTPVALPSARNSRSLAVLTS